MRTRKQQMAIRKDLQIGSQDSRQSLARLAPTLLTLVQDQHTEIRSGVEIARVAVAHEMIEALRATFPSMTTKTQRTSSALVRSLVTSIFFSRLVRERMFVQIFLVARV